MSALADKEANGGDVISHDVGATVTADEVIQATCRKACCPRCRSSNRCRRDGFWRTVHHEYLPRSHSLAETHIRVRCTVCGTVWDEPKHASGVKEL